MWRIVIALGSVCLVMALAPPRTILIESPKNESPAVLDEVRDLAGKVATRDDVARLELRGEMLERQLDALRKKN